MQRTILQAGTETKEPAAGADTSSSSTPVTNLSIHGEPHLQCMEMSRRQEQVTAPVMWSAEAAKPGSMIAAMPLCSSSCYTCWLHEVQLVSRHGR